MRLHEDPRAPNVRRVRLFIAEKGLDIPSAPVDIVAGDQRSAAFRAINPFGRVPVLELDDGTYLAESLAICRYLEALHPDPPLFGGPDPANAARVEMWNERVVHYLLYPIFHLFRHTHAAAMGLEPAQIAEWGEMNRDKLHAALDIFETALGDGRAWLTGDGYSIADINALAGIDFMRVCRERLDAQRWPRLKAWHERMQARPAVRATPVVLR
ncbi:MAG TPA: glutathione S-transferase family protein [Thermopetrobacter sp.]|nr:glutathione S-transferase family protein [Thermopetrobacter sp.]